MILIWYGAATAKAGEPGIGTALLDSTDVASYLAAHPVPLKDSTSGAPLEIPTRVFLQSFEFTSANDLEVSGYIWQKYDTSIPDDVTRGFVLPEALAEAYSAQEVDRFVENGIEVITWYFHATLRQQFDYERYPFDRHEVWLRIWHPDRDRNLVLVPDFASYTTTNPSSMPGIDSQIVYSGWEPEFAQFSFATNTYNTTLGMSPGESNLGAPELYYGVGLKRSFVGPLVTHVIPMVAIFLLLFVCLMLVTDEDAGLERSGFRTGTAVAFCASLLFAALLSHNLIRAIIPDSQFAYLEQVIMIGYAVIFGVAAYAALLSISMHSGRFGDANPRLARLAYWPLVTGLLFAVSVVSLRFR